MIIRILHYLLVITILVFVHELGHFLMARWRGIKVLRFSIGFGKSLFSWYDKKGTEYVLAWLPLGGYIKLADNEDNLNSHELTFPKAPLLSKIFVILGGPFFNLAFATLIYWALFLHGTMQVIPMLGTVPVDSAAYKAGLQSKDIVITLQDTSIRSWADIATVLIEEWRQKKKEITVAVERETSEGKVAKKVVLRLPETDTTLIFTKEGLEGLGLTPYDPIPPIVKSVFDNLPAAKAGFKAGDYILSIDHHPMHSRDEVVRYVQKHPAKVLNMELDREGQKVTVQVTPAYKELGKVSVGYIGIEFEQKEWPQELLRKQTFSFGEAFKEAVKKTVEYSVLTLQMLHSMITGEVSWRYLSGPVTIAKQASESSQYGAISYLLFLSMLSVSLGVINLLPLPLLDGGQLVLFCIEGLTGRQCSEQVKLVLFKLGALILMALTFLALYNDLFIK